MLSLPEGVILPPGVNRPSFPGVTLLTNTRVGTVCAMGEAAGTIAIVGTVWTTGAGGCSCGVSLVGEDGGIEINEVTM